MEDIPEDDDEACAYMGDFSLKANENDLRVIKGSTS